jgi:thymidylate kinase
MNDYRKNYFEVLSDNKGINRERIFNLLLEFFVHNHINYALLGPLNDYFSLKEDGDIDFVVSQKDFKNISRQIQKFCNQNNLILVQMRKHERTACIFVLSYYNPQEKKIEYIKIDFCTDYTKRGRYYISWKELLDNRAYKWERNYWQLNDTYSFIYYLIKKIDKTQISSSQFLQLMKYWRNATPTIYEKLRKFLDEESVRIIVKSFEEKNVDYFMSELGNLKENLHKKISRRLTDIIAAKIRTFSSTFTPPGIVVCVLGRDGSGKSTFVNEMINSMKPYFSKTEKFHTFPGLLYRRGIFNRKNGFKHSSPHNQKVRNSHTSFLKLNLFFTESLFGYWFKIFPRKMKSHFIVFDRCFIDVLADPVRYRIKTNKIYIKTLHYILPKPDIWIILDLPTDVLFTRKQELDYETAEKLRHAYLNLHGFLSNSIVINNEGEIKETVKKASTFILNYMHEKVQ